MRVAGHSRRKSSNGLDGTSKVHPGGECGWNSRANGWNVLDQGIDDDDEEEEEDEDEELERGPEDEETLPGLAYKPRLASDSATSTSASESADSGG